MSKPNLFNYATKELSQDAMICWLLEWAKPEYENTDRNLHLCGVSLVKELIIKEYPSFKGSISTLTIDPQHSCIIDGKKRSIDILCTVNDEYIILIEDKTNTSDGKIKLEDYLTYVKEIYKL